MCEQVKLSLRQSHIALFLIAQGVKGRHGAKDIQK